MSNNIFEAIKEGAKTSTWLTFLIFSFILVIYSINSHSEEKYVFVSFFTLFFALLSHIAWVIRKSEHLEPYAIGGNLQLILYTLFSFFLLAGWIGGTIVILTMFDSVTGYLINPKTALAEITAISLVLAFLIFIIWQIIIFYLKFNHDRRDNTTEPAGVVNENFNTTVGIKDFTVSIRKSKRR